MRVIDDACVAQSGAVQDDVSREAEGAGRRGPPLALHPLHQLPGQLGHVRHHRHAWRQQRLLQRRGQRFNSLRGVSRVSNMFYYLTWRDVSYAYNGSLIK